MESVEQVIDYILEQSQFDLGYVETVGGQPSRSWANRPGEVISVHELRQLMSGEDSGAPDPAGAREARLVCPVETLSLLVEHLQVLLSDFVDTENDTIGHALPSVGNEHSHESVTFQPDGLFARS